MSTGDGVRVGRWAWHEPLRQRRAECQQIHVRFPTRDMAYITTVYSDRSSCRIAPVVRMYCLRVDGHDWHIGLRLLMDFTSFS